MMFKSTIPLDIIQNIVDILVDVDEEGLEYVKAVSLTCQSFLPLCRKHIFSSISITMDYIRPSMQPTPEAFEHFLSETPAIAKYIRQLTICIVQRPSFESDYSFDQVARQLTRIQSLTVSLWSVHNDASIDWNDIPSSLRRSLLNLMHLPTLSCLVLQTIKNFPISNLITCANLKHLHVKNLHVGGGEHDETVSSLLHQSMQLQSLHMGIGGSKMLALLTARCPNGRPAIDFTGLEKISIYFHSDWRDAAVPTREIFKKAQGLVDVNLEGDDIDFPELAKMITPSLQTLRRLRMQIFIENHSQDPLAVICDELEHISGKNNLESIDIKIILQTNEGCGTGTEWGRLEELLLQSGWPMLKHISLVILLHSFGMSRIDGPFGMALESLPETQFTGLMTSRNLDFEFSVEEDFV